MRSADIRVTRFHIRHMKWLDDSRWLKTPSALLNEIVTLEKERRAMYDAARTFTFDIDEADTRLRRPAARSHCILQLAQLYEMATDSGNIGSC